MIKNSSAYKSSILQILGSEIKENIEVQKSISKSQIA